MKGDHGQAHRRRSRAIMDRHIAAGLTIGIGVGVALGAAMGNVGAGIAIGIAIGIAVGSSRSRADKGSSSSDENGPNEDSRG